MPEDLLRKYRPVGPRPALRRAALYGPPALDGAPAWPWAVAAAALLAMTVGFQVATRSLARQALEPGGGAPGFDARVMALSDVLGDGEEAQRQALLLEMEEELTRRLPRPGGLEPQEPLR